jgi:hypothetical protein
MRCISSVASKPCTHGQEHACSHTSAHVRVHMCTRRAKTTHTHTHTYRGRQSYLGDLPHAEETKDVVDTVCVEVLLHVRQAPAPPLWTCVCVRVMCVCTKFARVHIYTHSDVKKMGTCSAGLVNTCMDLTAHRR